MARVFEFLGNLALEFGDGVWSVASGLLAWGIGMIADLLLVLSAALPDDPFQLPQVAADWELGLSWLNWFIPVGQLAALLGVWVAATVGYYAFQFILKQMAAAKL